MKETEKAKLDEILQRHQYDKTLVIAIMHRKQNSGTGNRTFAFNLGNIGCGNVYNFCQLFLGQLFLHTCSLDSAEYGELVSGYGKGKILLNSAAKIGRTASSHAVLPRHLRSLPG